MTRALVPSLLVCLLAACASPVQQLPSAQSWADHKAQLQRIDRFEATGKLALRSPDVSESGNLVWRQDGARTDIFLSGPFGVAPTNIHSDGRELVVKQGTETNTVDLNNPDAVRAATGWDYPLQALPYWIRGLPAPSLQLQQLEQDSVTGGASLLAQSGWEVRYERYGRFGELNLPTRIVITDGEAKATVLLRQWRIDSHKPAND